MSTVSFGHHTFTYMYVHVMYVHKFHRCVVALELHVADYHRQHGISFYFWQKFWFFFLRVTRWCMLPIARTFIISMMSSVHPAHWLKLCMSTWFTTWSACRCLTSAVSPPPPPPYRPMRAARGISSINVRRLSGENRRAISSWPNVDALAFTVTCNMII